MMADVPLERMNLAAVAMATDQVPDAPRMMCPLLAVGSEPSKVTRQGAS
ncbi:MAG: hypothetical protein V9G29_02885 [Burkholderiaceae bacterium]